MRAPPPEGATGDGGFRATPDMMSILGCSADGLGHVLKSLGFWAERKLVPPEVKPSEPVEAPAPAEDAAAPKRLKASYRTAPQR